MKIESTNPIYKKIFQLKTGIRNKMEKLSEKLEFSVVNNASAENEIVFGPVHSRRLGKSLGINNIKRKICTYGCVYCQAGQTTCCTLERNCCLSPYELYFCVKSKINKLEKEKYKIDFVSYVPNGEPTLDNNLSKEIALLREFGYKIAVFTNGSLLWNDNVKENLMFADYVSIKIDTGDELTWEKINRPHPRLRFEVMLKGIADFSKLYRGVLTTETMLVKGVNDNIEEMEKIGELLKHIKCKKSYFTIPIRPPAKKGVMPPDKEVLQELSEYIKKYLPGSEMLCCPEIEDFRGTDNFESEFMAIVTVHPMREDSVREYLSKKSIDWSVIEDMIKYHKIKETIYMNHKFYSLETND